MTDQIASSEEKYTINTDDSGLKLVGFIVLVITFGFFGGWAFFAPLDSAVYGVGGVQVRGFSKTVQHLEGGIIQAIHVRDGDAVTRGQVLLKLEDTQIKAQQEIIRGQYLSFKAMESRLLAEQNAQQEIIFPEELRNSEDAGIQELIINQSNIFLKRKKSIDGKISILNQKITQFRSKLGGYSDQLISKKKLAVLYADEINELESLVDEGFADRPRLRELQRRQAEVEANIAAIISERAAVEIQIGEAEIQILQLKTEMEEEVAVELNKVQTQLLDLSEKRVALKDMFDRTWIRAPIDGYVLGLSVHTDGGVVRAGEEILHIVPEKDDLIISARVSPVDIDRIKKGQHAEVRFSSFKIGVTPKLLAEVEHVSADSLADEKDGMPYFEVRLGLTPESRESIRELKLLPGMPADVLIASGERTFWQYLIQPITDAYAKALIEE